MPIVRSRTAAAIAIVCVVCAWVVAPDVVATPSAQRRPTFAADIAPVVLTHCAPCHRPGQAAPFILLSYDDARAKGKEIVAATQSHRMPPWLATQGQEFPALQDDRRLTDRQIAAIAAWVNNGMPSGDLRRAPMPASFPQTWPLGAPDLTIALPRVVAVPAGGSDASRNVVIPVGIPANLWIGAVDYQPSGGGALRHARFFVAPPDLVVAADDVLPGVGGLLGGGSLDNYSDQLLATTRALTDLGGWVPGLARRFLPDGLAIRVPARSNVIVQMHLRPGTQDTTEDGRIGVYFAKPSARRAVMPLEVPPAFGIVAGLAIPAGEPRYVLKDAFVLPVEVEAVGARGYANVLGREMTMTATLPNGAKRGLLKIGRWDVDWPDSYFFATPVRLPKGTTIAVEIVYDNSAGNPRNLFSPPRPIAWGRLSVGEMGSMTLLITAPAGTDARALDAAMSQHLRDQLLARVR